MKTILDKKFAEGKKTGFQIGLQEGKETGFQIGRKEALIETNLKLLTRKFGKLPENIENQVKSLSFRLLQDLNIESVEIKSVDELENCLQIKFSKQ